MTDVPRELERMVESHGRPGEGGEADAEAGTARGKENDWAWATDDLGHVPPEVDTSKPSIARVYDAALGGKDNYAVDRAVIAEALKISPAPIGAARANRDLLIRGVRHLARQGVDQFLDLGSGLPSAQNTHQVAQAENPNARVVYVDNDPIVRAHGEALLARNASTRVVMADLLDVAGVFGHPEVAGFLDFSRPVGLVMLSVVHHILDEEDPVGVVNAYKDRVAPGSHLFLSHFCNSFPEARALKDVLLRGIGRGQLRSTEEIAAFFDGFELLEPGIVPTPQWRPDAPVSQPLDDGGLLIVGGMGRKP